MSKSEETAVFIGRFQPIHICHLEIIENAAAAYKQVLVLVGSADSPRTLKNPFSYHERKEMILQAANNPKIIVEWLIDYPDSDTDWALHVKKIVNEIATGPPVLLGNKKDASSFYLDMFPEWKRDVQFITRQISATDIRTAFFDNKLETVKHLLAPSTFDKLNTYIDTPWYLRLKAEKNK